MLLPLFFNGLQTVPMSNCLRRWSFSITQKLSCKDERPWAARRVGQGAGLAGEGGGRAGLKDLYSLERQCDPQFRPCLRRLYIPSPLVGATRSCSGLQSAHGTCWARGCRSIASLLAHCRRGSMVLGLEFARKLRLAIKQIERPPLVCGTRHTENDPS